MALGIRRNNAFGTSEFPLALFVFFFLLLFPLIDLSMLAAAYGMCCLYNHQVAVRVAAQQNYADALYAMTDEADKMSKSGFSSFAQLAPRAGYGKCGSDLYVDVTNYINKQTKSYGPNAPVPGPLDPTSSIYEYRVESNFTMQPLVNLSGIPVIGNVPGIGSPANIHWASHRLCEHIDGLTGLNNSGLSFTGGISSTNLNLKGLEDMPGELTDLSGSDWYKPTLYDQATASGGVATSDVIVVDASNPSWTQSRVSAAAGNQLLVDYWVDGYWSVDGKSSCDADGYANQVVSDGDTKGLPVGAMLATMGDGRIFKIGKNSDITLSRGGTLSFCFNDGKFVNGAQTQPAKYGSHGGLMFVRVVVVR